MQRAYHHVNSAKDFIKKLKTDSKKTIVGYMEAEAKPLKSISEMINSIKQEEQSLEISPEKRYAFLGGKTTDENLQRLIPESSSIYDLQKAIDDLLKTLKSLKPQ